MMKKTHLHPLFILLPLALLLASCYRTAEVRDNARLRADDATQPAQPASGPGGSDYRHGAVTEKRIGAKGEHSYMVFLPAEPTPESAPVVVFIHGWTALDPDIYRAWMNHIVRRGNIVIYPQYQKMTSPAGVFVPNNVRAVKEAITLLQAEGPVRPQLDKFALVGHSAGAVCAVNVAAVAVEEGLPTPRAVMAVEPGRWANPARLDPRYGLPLEDLSKIPVGALVLVLVGDADVRVGFGTAKEIFGEIGRIPDTDKDYVIVRSDDHGYPPLVADHHAPATGLGSVVDALDYYAYWKLFDGLLDAAFYGKDRQYALGDTPEQRFMGAWSDGVRVRELIVTDRP